MDMLWIVGLVLVLDAFLLAYLKRSGKVVTLPLFVPVAALVAGILLIAVSLLS